MRLVHLYCSLAVVILLAGCVSEPVKEYRTHLIVTRSGTRVDMQWQSDPGRTYTVLYSDSLASGSRWQVLPGAEKIRGTGGLIQLQDTAPVGVQRYYDLRIDLVP